METRQFIAGLKVERTGYPTEPNVGRKGIVLSANSVTKRCLVHWKEEADGSLIKVYKTSWVAYRRLRILSEKVL